MATFVESFSTAILLILAIILLSHLLNGSASEWFNSKFKTDIGPTK